MKIKESGTNPYPYWILENPMHSATAQEVFLELSSLADNPHYVSQMYKYENPLERKLATDKYDLFPPITRAWLTWTLTSQFIQIIQDITGIEGLVADPWFRGGGIHLHRNEGILRPHIDFDFHQDLNLVRRLNFIIYFNKNYSDDWGGALELWSPDGQELTKTIKPEYNMGVLFETPNAVHGFLKPWAAPNGITRKSLAVYLYTSPTKEDLDKPHFSTRFIKTSAENDTEEITKLRELRSKGRLNSNV